MKGSLQAKRVQRQTLSTGEEVKMNDKKGFRQYFTSRPFSFRSFLMCNIE